MTFRNRSAGTYFPPYESYKGAVVGSHYQLQQLQLQSDFLDIYSVTCLCSGGTRFEAQAFSLSLPRGNGRDNMGSNSNSSSSSNSSDSSDNGRGSGSDDDGNGGASKLLASRRRRMRRIYRSQNFVGSFERGGKRFLVSKVTRSDTEWREVCWQIRRHQKEEHQQHDFIVNSQCTDARTRVHSGEEKSRGLAKGSGTPGPSCRWSPHAMSSLDQKSTEPASPVLPSKNSRPLSYAHVVARGLGVNEDGTS